MCFKQPKAPNYQPVADASVEAARYGKEAADNQLAFAREQHAFSQQQYYELKPIFEQISGQQITAQDQQMAQAQDYYNYQQDTYRPLEQGLVARAQKFNTDAYREGLAQQAKADTERAFAGQDRALEAQMLSMGTNPNSGRFQGLAQRQDIQQAAQQASAMNATRSQAEGMGYARQLDAAGLGRNLAGASSGAYAGALSAGNSAGGNAAAPGQNYMANSMAIGSLQQGAYGLGQTGLNTQVQGLSNVLGAQTDVYGQQLQANASMTGAVMGGVAGLGGNWMEFMS